MCDSHVQGVNRDFGSQYTSDQLKISYITNAMAIS